MRRGIRTALALAVCQLMWTSESPAEEFGGIEFPQGASSFADAVIVYDPLHSGGPGPTAANFLDPAAAVGSPDYTGGSNGVGSVALGDGGLLELAFVDNLLSNSGDTAEDLHIFEIGPAVEATFVAIRPTTSTLLLLLPLLAADPSLDLDGDGFFEIGAVAGATSSIDIDSIFPGFPSGVLTFDAVQLIDDPSDSACCAATGADIDSVGAISSELAPSVPMVSDSGLFALAIGLLVSSTMFLRKTERV